MLGKSVIPAFAGIHTFLPVADSMAQKTLWIPAKAGMTVRGRRFRLIQRRLQRLFQFCDGGEALKAVFDPAVGVQDKCPGLVEPVFDAG